MPTLREALFPAGLILKPGELLVCVEHGPDELGVHILRSLVPEQTKPIDLHVNTLPSPSNNHVVCAVLPVRSPRANKSVLRHACHILDVRALSSGAASDVHGSITVTKMNGRWRRNILQIWRFRLRRDGMVDVFR